MEEDADDPSPPEVEEEEESNNDYSSTGESAVTRHAKDKQSERAGGARLSAEAEEEAEDDEMEEEADESNRPKKAVTRHAKDKQCERAGGARFLVEEENEEAEDDDDGLSATGSNNVKSNTSKYQSPRYTDVVKCQYCQMSMKRKNYGPHIKNKHPGKDPKNLRPHGVQTLSNFMNLKRKNSDQNSERKRHRSGDSGVGDGEEEDEDVEQGDLGTVDQRIEVDDHQIPAVTRHAEDKQITPESTTPPSHIQDSTELSNNQMLKLLLIKINSMEDKLNNVNEKLDKLTATRHAEDKQKPSSSNLSPDELNILNQVSLCKTITDIVNLGFQYENDVVSCKICPKNQIDYIEGETKFKAVKWSVKRHLKSDRHKGKVNESKLKDDVEEKLESKNIQAGMNCGRIVYKLIKKGRPNIDYETDVLLIRKSGGIIGRFPQKLVEIKS